MIVGAALALNSKRDLMEPNAFLDDASRPGITFTNQ